MAVLCQRHCASNHRAAQINARRFSVGCRLRHRRIASPSLRKSSRRSIVRRGSGAADAGGRPPENCRRRFFLCEGWAEQLPFAAGQFDAVVSCNMFHYIRRPAEALREMRRVLRPGGRLIVTDWCDDFSPAEFADGICECSAAGILRFTAKENSRDCWKNPAAPSAGWNPTKSIGCGD